MHQNNSFNLSHSAPEELLRPYSYLTRQSGKEIRARLISAFNQWLKVSNEEISKIKEITSLLHNASLLIDDIEDNSKLRRGAPVAHLIYGVADTINCANYVYFLSLQACLNLNYPEAMRIFTEELLNLHRGQGHDIYWRDSNKCPTEEEYKQMVLDKTGGLFRLSVRLMQCSSTNKSDLTTVVNLLGLYFQIRDDYINLQSDEYMLNKSFCEDLTEGKFSFPIIYHIRNSPSGFEVQRILQQKTESVDLKKYAVEQMKTSGSFEYTLSVIHDIKRQLLDEISRLGGNTELVAIVNHLDSTMSS